MTDRNGKAAAPLLPLPLRPRDEDRLRAALREADLSIVLMVLVQLTGEARYLDEFAAAVRPGASPDATTTGRLHELLVQALYDARGPAPELDAAMFGQMMSVCVGQEVPPEYVPMIREDLGFETAPGLAGAHTLAQRLGEDFRILIIGVGAAGLCAAMHLARAGIAFEIVEKNPDVGGTWFENRYPGAGVDAPNHLYSYSFEQNHSWSRFFVRQPELLKYFQDCARRYNLYERITFDTEVVSAKYADGEAVWHVTLRGKDGRLQERRANAVISAVGQLNRPSIPQIPGLEGFEGTAVHTGTWHEGVQVAGKRVAMVGTGASGMQVAPTIAPQVERLTIFQRSPNWIRTRPRYHEEVGPGKQWVLSALPFYATWYRFQLFWANSDALHQALQKAPGWSDSRSISPLNADLRKDWEGHMRSCAGDDRELLGKVLPDYPPFGKRPLLDNKWFEMLRRPNVELVTDPVDRIDGDAVVTRSGSRHPVDVIVFATGFQASRMLYPMDIQGRHGTSLRELWGEENPRAYLGMTVPGFPNFFLLYGPNTNLGHGGSVIFHLEIQVRYILGCLQLLADTASRAMECRQQVHDDYNQRVDAAHEAMVWTHAGVNNWYKNRLGRVTTNSPWRIVDYWTMARAPREADFVFDRRHGGGEPR
ncbi:NAD(P)/FAD-dependent oxidoreductase [Ramlibacter sp. AN1015]|uniref:flavin-containing monooxygenase n=1 Tax=Ramlibacter sp. AN1015 TaxID=3133428 RepID=UPI0030BBA49D